MSSARRPVAVVTPLHGNAATLAALAHRLDSAMAGREWRLRFVVDGSPDESVAVAWRLSQADDRIRCTVLPASVGQHRALARGLGDEEQASAWVCLDADLQDPPEAVPALLDRLARGDVSAVFAGRRGRYESRGRLVTGWAHRAVLARLTGLPPDAGAFVALGPAGRDAILEMSSPSIVAAIGVAGVPVTSVPVERASRPSGGSAWTSSARVRQSVSTIVWVLAARSRRHAPAGASQRWTRTSE